MQLGEWGIVTSVLSNGAPLQAGCPLVTNIHSRAFTTLDGAGVKREATLVTNYAPLPLAFYYGAPSPQQASTDVGLAIMETLNPKKTLL